MSTVLKLGVPVAILAFCLPVAAQSDAPEFFEKKIRPVLATKCYPCHSSKLKVPMGGLVLDTKAGLERGGSLGAVIVPKKPAESRLLTALLYTDPHLQMPPGGKLADDSVQAFSEWIASGAVDPRVDTGVAAAVAPKGIDLEKGRRWWSFQPVHELPAPKVAAPAWPRTKIDSFILAALDKNRLTPSPEADSRTLIRRVSLDLIGLAPTYEEAEAFARDKTPQAYEKLVDRLLASPHYGERWGRYWLDLARYGEDNPMNGVSLLPYPFAWRYRDWVIEALNKDLSYDRFVKLQLAADEIAGVPREDMRALGFLGTGPITHKDARLSAEVVETFAADDWDERVDTVSRGLMGLTVACARCHDHKFDPIRTKDYYALAGVFASTSSVAWPMFPMDAPTEKRFLFLQQRLYQLDYFIAMLSREPGSEPVAMAKRVAAFQAETKLLMAEIEAMGQRYPEIPKLMAKYNTWAGTPYGKLKGLVDTSPFLNGVYDAGVWIDAKDPTISVLDYRPGQARDLHVFRHGNVANQGELAPRAFPAVLSKRADATFHNGPGRAELADRIFSDAQPLAARVIVNRVWGWHFGKPLVTTPSDFGTQGDKPTNPDLLDDLAARFIAHGWSLKWLHREILLSAAYRQSSRPHMGAEPDDQENRLLSRFNARRLDIEAYRDSILRASGALDETVSGPSVYLEAPGNNRRTIYSKISREFMETVFELYDVPNPSQHSPERNLTTTPLQQLFVLNSPFFQQQAALLAKSVEGETGNAEKATALYRKLFARDPSLREADLAVRFLTDAPVARYAQALLATDEFIFWP